MQTNLDASPIDDSGLAVLGDVAVKTSAGRRDEAAPPPERTARTALIRIRIAGSRARSTAHSAVAATARPKRRLEPATSTSGLPLYVITAYEGGRVVGALGVRLDSMGALFADRRFPGQLAALRSRGLRLCELTGLAIDERAPRKTVLASLFHAAFLYAHRLNDADAAVTEIAPRHAQFLVRALRCECIAQARADSHSGLPTALLYLPFARIAQGIAQSADRSARAGKEAALFPYTFSATEEHGILERMRAQHAALIG